MLTPVGKRYVSALVGASASGPFGRLEAGWHPLTPLGAFTFAEVRRGGWMAGLGARWTF